MHLLDKLGNLHRPSVIAQRHRISRQSRQLVEQRNHALQVLLDGEVESVAVFQIRGDVQDAADVVERQQLAARGVHAAKVAAEQDAEGDALHFASPGMVVLVVGILRGGLGEGLHGGDFLVDAFAGGGENGGNWSGGLVLLCVICSVVFFLRSADGVECTLERTARVARSGRQELADVHFEKCVVASL